MIRLTLARLWLITDLTLIAASVLAEVNAAIRNSRMTRTDTATVRDGRMVGREMANG